ncbi:MAG: response regulator transcription factor [bacterium]
MIKILIVEDEQNIAENVRKLIKSRFNNLDVFVCDSIASARQVIYKNRPHILILDINLPDGKGTDLYKEYREFYPEGVVIFLTSIDSDIEKIIALELGAEDYIVKPYNPQELLAKINNWIKRISKANKEYIHICSDYYFDKLSGNILIYKDNFYHFLFNLTYNESKLFEILICNVNKIVDIESIISELNIDLSQIPVIIYNLRRKFSKIANLKIHTIKGGKLKLVIQP